MGFFKGFKRDFAQAVNELMPEYDGSGEKAAEEENDVRQEENSGTLPETEGTAAEQEQEESGLPDFSAAPVQEAEQVNLDEAVTEAMLREEGFTSDFYSEEKEEEEFGVIPAYEMEGQLSMFESVPGEAQQMETAPEETFSGAVQQMPAETEDDALQEDAAAEVTGEVPEEASAEEAPEAPAAKETQAVKEESEEREDQELSELGTEIRKEDGGFDLGDTTYITKNTTISGDIETEGSLDVIGTVNGNVSCLGKLILGGRINGDLMVGELYTNQAHIRGEIEASGHIKIGAGTISIGNIRAQSAVIAGAVKGDIDVQGQVVVDSTAVVLGNIKSKSVQVNSGAIVDGFCTQVYSDVNPENIFLEDGEEKEKEEEAEVIEAIESIEAIEPISEEENASASKNGGGNRQNNRNRKNGGQKQNNHNKYNNNK